jgi:SAM-dependent methyltransferase
MVNKIQEKVKGMYEAHPFPNFEDPFDPEWLQRYQKYFHYLGATSERFQNSLILDAGCGTGEKTLYMSGLGAAQAIGLDLSEPSVRKARQSAKRYGIANARFCNGSVLELPFADAIFDIVLSSGVLHHTVDPYKGFTELVRVLKPDGLLMVYLYSQSGHWVYDVERAFIHLLAGKDLDRRVRISKRLFGFRERRLAARGGHDLDTRLYDKYAHPRASAHSMGQILRWFRLNGIAFHGIYPPVNMGDILIILAQKDAQGGYRIPAILRPAAWLAHGMLRVSPRARAAAPFQAPGFMMRFLVQTGFFIAGFYDYSFGVSYSGIKKK